MVRQRKDVILLINKRHLIAHGGDQEKKRMQNKEFFCERKGKPLIQLLDWPQL